MIKVAVIGLVLFTVTVLMISPSSSPSAPAEPGVWEFGDYVIRIQNPSLQSLTQFNEKSTEKGLIIELYSDEELEPIMLEYNTNCKAIIHFLKQGFDEEFSKYKHLIIVVPRENCYEVAESDSHFVINITVFKEPKIVDEDENLYNFTVDKSFTIKIPFSVLFNNSESSLDSVGVVSV